MDEMEKIKEELEHFVNCGYCGNQVKCKDCEQMRENCLGNIKDHLSALPGSGLERLSEEAVREVLAKFITKSFYVKRPDNHEHDTIDYEVLIKDIAKTLCARFGTPAVKWPEKYDEDNFTTIIPAHIIRAEENNQTQTITPIEGHNLDEKCRIHGYNQAIDLCIAAWKESVK